MPARLRAAGSVSASDPQSCETRSDTAGQPNDALLCLARQEGAAIGIGNGASASELGHGWRPCVIPLEARSNAPTVLVPFVLGYTVFVYYTFRGKIRPGEGYH